MKIARFSIAGWESYRRVEGDSVIQGDLEIITRLNGKERDRGSTSGMVHKWRRSSRSYPQGLRSGPGLVVIRDMD